MSSTTQSFGSSTCYGTTPTLEEVPGASSSFKPNVPNTYACVDAANNGPAVNLIAVSPGGTKDYGVNIPVSPSGAPFGKMVLFFSQPISSANLLFAGVI